MREPVVVDDTVLQETLADLKATLDRCAILGCTGTANERGVAASRMVLAFATGALLGFDVKRAEIMGFVDEAIDRSGEP